MRTEKKTAFLLVLAAAISFIIGINLASAQSPVIVVSTTPKIINADGLSHEIITIELQTESGQPLLAPIDTPIQLTLSNLDIGSVDQFVTIPEGKTFVKAMFTAKKNSGLAIVSASSPGYVTGEGYIQVLRSNFDASLKVYASPNSQPAKVGEKGVVVVQLLDSQGEPFTAIDDVYVTLTSSNNSICTVTRNVIIEKGENYASVEFTVSGTTPGDALISAQAQGFAPGNDIVNTFNITGTPKQVAIFLGPDTVLPDEKTHDAVTVQLQNQYGEPTPALEQTTVYLSSSNTNIASIQEVVTIQAGEYKVTAAVTTYSVNGESTIAASSTGLYPDYESILVQGQIPTLMELYVNPGIIIADGSDYDIITLQLLDEQGNPVEARQDTPIHLTSSNAQIGSVPESIIVPIGQNYATATFTSTGLPGETMIAATTMGIEPTELKLETMTMQFNMSLVTPNTIRINQTFEIYIEIESSGIPIPNVGIDWTALGGVILLQDNVTNMQGVAVAQIIQKYDQLRLKVVASKAGYDSKEVQKNIQITQDVEKVELTVRILGRDIQVFHILILLAVIIAVALGAYVYLKYKKSHDEEPDDLEIYS